MFLQIHQSTLNFTTYRQNKEKFEKDFMYKNVNHEIDSDL